MGKLFILTCIYFILFLIPFFITFSTRNLRDQGEDNFNHLLNKIEVEEGK